MTDHDFPQERDAPKPLATRRFVLWTTGLLLAGVALFLLVAQLSVFGKSAHAVFAIILGVAFTIGLAVALMALVFYSNRSGHDDEVGE